MATIVVAAAQIRSTPNRENNLNQAIEAIAMAAAQGAELIVLPEAAADSFDVRPNEVAEPLDGPFATAIRHAAHEASATVVVGMFEPAAAGRAYNTLLVTGPHGEQTYRKVHLFDAFDTTESEVIAPGAEYVVVDIGGVKLGLATCYDVRFAEQFTELGRRGAHVIAVPASWGSGPGKEEQWDLLIRARALDSQAFVVAADQAWQDTAKPMGIGRSAVIGPTGRIEGQLGSEPGLLVQPIDLDRVDEVRKQIPILKWEGARHG